jgi:hypothetical protein
MIGCRSWYCLFGIDAPEGWTGIGYQRGHAEIQGEDQRRILIGNVKSILNFNIPGSRQYIGLVAVANSEDT